jgi:hypothetical protein
MRTTYQDLQNSRIPASLGVGINDPRLLQWTNEAMERLLYMGKWWGTVARFNICATNGCITLPRQIATIEAVNVCGHPVPVRDFWYEFLANGFGTRESQTTPNGGGCCGGGGGMSEAISRGRFPVFTDITGSTSKLHFVCDVSTDAGKQVLLLGYDANGNWIRTMQNGAYADGEMIALAQGAGTTSVNFFTVITDLQFQSAMDGQSWLYALDTTTALLTMLGHYQYDEPHPSYARYYFPGINPKTGTTGCNTVKVEIVGKLDFIPVKVPSDYLIIQNLPALKEMMSALKKSENQADSTAANNIIAGGMATAMEMLDKQLDHYLGSGRTIGINVVGSSVGDNEPVLNFL